MKIKVYDDVVERYKKMTVLKEQDNYTIKFLKKIQGKTFEVEQECEDYYNTDGFGVNDKRMEAPYVDGYCILKKYIEKVEKNT
jgi:hypothetical protein